MAILQAWGKGEAPEKIGIDEIAIRLLLDVSVSQKIRQAGGMKGYHCTTHIVILKQIHYRYMYWIMKSP